MYDHESDCFDNFEASLQEGLVQEQDDFSQGQIPNCDNNHNFSMEGQIQIHSQIISPQEAAAAAAVMEMEMQKQLDLEFQGTNNDNNNSSAASHLIQEMVHNSNWHEMCSFNGDHNQYQYHPNITDIQNTIPDTPYPTTPDLLNMFPFPRCSSSFLLNNPDSSAHKSSSFLASLGLLGEFNPAVDVSAMASGSVVYDPLLPLNHSPQPPFLRELFHSLPHQGGGYAIGVKNGSLFGGIVDEREHVNGVLYQDGNDGRHFDNGVFEFSAGEIDCIMKNNGKETKHFTNTEKHRRVLFSDKYQALRKLIPNPTKNDRASIVGDAIDYINELKRTVNELKVLTEKKRCSKERLKRPKTEEKDGISMEGNESNSLGEMEQPYNCSSLRSSWLHRKSKNTEVDVRIVDDEVTVKLVQQKRINCLLFVSKVLDDLQLDLHHVAGGLIGDYYSFLFNSKICEGSIVYASAIANKLIEVVDKHYASVPPTNSY
ncbi:transcription factor bHLH91-like [Primulina huaijiensis]|uniref:transcription factor bHLH91-like n=1 Tax=Primulina huaijiensis TaxID=1492673 RepID=UPI003CC76C28